MRRRRSRMFGWRDYDLVIHVEITVAMYARRSFFARPTIGGASMVESAAVGCGATSRATMVGGADFVAFIESVKSLAVLRQSYHASIAERYGLSMSKIDCLFHLAIRGEIATSELGELVGLSPSAMTSAVDRLVDKGLVTRRIDESDRRVTMLAATPAGCGVIAESMTRLAAGFSDTEIDLHDAACRIVAIGAVYREHSWPAD